MAVKAFEQYRPVGDHRVQVFLVGQGFAAEFGIAPSSAQDPRRLRMGFGKRFHRFLDIRQILGLVEP